MMPETMPAAGLPAAVPAWTALLAAGLFLLLGTLDRFVTAAEAPAGSGVPAAIAPAAF
jgi:hypothetical protein